MWSTRRVKSGSVSCYSGIVELEAGSGENERAATPSSPASEGASRPDTRVKTSATLRRVRTLQDRLLHLLGSSREERGVLVAAMLRRNANEATSYWLQLVVAIGIATLGLVVGSAAVIIGAMLIAPLMVPIVALAMGLATGSPFLVLRSAGRIVLSVVGAIGGAALITLLLPFHELNTEIAARTSPTVLDLLAAAFCAVAGVYAALRAGSDTATTAAGTSIGISLVPPLCASGYGLGTQAWSVAGGAALLFLTNLVAIIFVGTVSFVAAGFNRVDVTALERAELAKNQRTVVTAAIARRLAVLFESKAGPALRFLMPLFLLAAVYVPLHSALDEVAWQVRVRAAVRELLRGEHHEIVESRVRVERREVDVLVVLLGTTADAEASRARLDTDIRRIAGVLPRIEVIAIPDAHAFAGLESSLRTSHDARRITALSPPPTPAEQLESARSLMRESVARVWPATAAGEPLLVEADTAASGPLTVRVVHLGPALQPDASESLLRSLAVALGREVRLVDVAVPSTPLSRAGGDLKFVSEVSVGVRASVAASAVNVCVVEPEPAQGKRPVDRRAQELAETLKSVLALHPRVSLARGSDWTVRFTTDACAELPVVDAGVDAGPASLRPEK